MDFYLHKRVIRTYLNEVIVNFVDMHDRYDIFLELKKYCIVYIAKEIFIREFCIYGYFKSIRNILISSNRIPFFTEGIIIDLKFLKYKAREYATNNGASKE